jgi:hypothetical protein
VLPEQPSRETDEAESSRRKSDTSKADVPAVDHVDQRSRDNEEVTKRPRMKRRKKKKGRKRRTGLLVAVLAASFAGLSGIALALWWFVFSGQNVDAEPWVFVHSDANAIVGVDLDAVVKDLRFGPLIEDAVRTQGRFTDEMRKQTGLEYKELFAQTVVAYTVDRNFVAGIADMGLAPTVTLALRTSKAFSQAKMASSFKNSRKRKLNGQTYYEVDESPWRYAFMPSSRLVVVTSAPESQLAGMLGASASKPNVSAETASMIRNVNNKTVWGVMLMDARARPVMDDVIAAQPPALMLLKADDILRTTKALSWGINLDANRLQFGLNIFCADANTASKLASQAETRLQETRGQVGQLLDQLGELHKIKQVFREQLDSSKYRAEGSTIALTSQISLQTIGDAIKEFQELARNLPGAQPNGGMGRGPP